MLYNLTVAYLFGIFVICVYCMADKSLRTIDFNKHKNKYKFFVVLLALIFWPIIALKLIAKTMAYSIINNGDGD